jgi:hypothetical protein
MMITAFVGITMLIGLIILFNSAFTERGNLGFAVFCIGVLLTGGAFVEVIAGAFF